VELIEQQARKNGILKAFPRDQLLKLLPHMQMTNMPARRVIYRQGAPIEWVHFPTTAVMSLLMPTAEGDTVELATVGNEGFTGVIAILTPSTVHKHGALANAVTLIPGNAIQVRADLFQRAVNDSIELSHCIRTYVGALITSLALSVSCNRLHSLSQRCARWLLTVIDKGRRPVVMVTQEMLASALGVYRQSVIQILNDLEMKRVIQRNRGSITVQSQQRLTAMACECYHIAKKRIPRT
jgi:CRP-like cAMP-binding protein